MLEKIKSGAINVKEFGAAGSSFCATVQSKAGSDFYTTDNVGDFKVGDSVILNGGVPAVVNQQLFVRMDTSPINPRPPKRRFVITDELAFVGYSGPEKVTYIIDIYPEAPDTVRWSKDNGTTWTEGVPIVNREAEIENGCKLIINDFEDKEYGCTAVFSCASRAEAVVLSVCDNIIQLSVKATKSEKCQLLHSDSEAIQRAIDHAIATKGTVYFPNGEYRLSTTIAVTNAECLNIIGESGAGVILRNSDIRHENTPNAVNGPCFRLLNCRQVSIKGFTMIGNMGFDQRHLAGCVKTTKGVEPTKVYGFYFNYSSAITMGNNERVLIEDCHARRMSGEAFYAKSEPRTTSHTPDIYQKSLTYLNCSVEDSARNAFNNNDCGENTSVINSRIVNVGGCAWEGSSRFVKIIGNYIMNAGPVAIGNLRSRDEEHERLGTAQHVVSDNVFEGGVNYGGAGITVGAGASQVIIQNNSFVNFNSNAIHIVPHSQYNDLPPEHVIVTGNSMDMTAEYSPSEKRYGIRIGCDYATVSNNQIYSRNTKPDPNLTCIEYVENATNTIIHSNTLSGAAVGISVEEAKGVVGYVKDECSFFRMEPLFGLPGLPPVPRRRSHNFRDWIIRWENGDVSEIKFCNAEDKLITIKAPRECSTGERFTLYPPKASVIVRSNILSGNLSNMTFEGGSAERVVAADNVMI